MKHWLYLSVARDLMTEYYLIPCARFSDVEMAFKSLGRSIVDANVIYSEEIVEWFDFSRDIGERGLTVFTGVAFLNSDLQDNGRMRQKRRCFGVLCVDSRKYLTMGRWIW